jgi:small-conductance mechanosensitive channel
MENKLLEILFDPTIGKIVTIIIISLVIVSFSRFLKNRSRKFIKDNDFRYKFKKLITFFSYIIIIIAISVVFSDKLGGFTVALGVAGAGIAFALQEVIISIAGWLAISFSYFYRVGDRVLLGGIVGDVIDIGILRTTLMECGQWVAGDQYTGRIVRISNSNVFKDAVFNYSADFPFLWDEIKLPIRYGSDINLTRSILIKLADLELSEFTEYAKKEWEVMVDKYRIENASVEPSVFILANDNWIEFTLRYVVDYKKRRSMKDKLFMRIIEEVNNSNGKVQFASATFELVSVPSMNISLKKL